MNMVLIRVAVVAMQSKAHATEKKWKMAPRGMCAPSQVPIFGTFSRVARGRARERVKIVPSGLVHLAGAPMRG
jgi:predicted metal-binding membrane protein